MRLPAARGEGNRKKSGYQFPEAELSWEAGYIPILPIGSQMTEPSSEPTFPPAPPTAVLLLPAAWDVEVAEAEEVEAVARVIVMATEPLVVCGATVNAWVVVLLQ